MTTQIREAKESVVTAEILPTELYCILHEQMVHVERGICGMGHKVEVKTDEGVEVDFCCFDKGHAFTAPPAELDDLPEGWECQPDEISDDERAQAECNEVGMWLRGME